MNSARTFAVETVVPKAFIVSELPWINKGIVSEFLSRGIEGEVVEIEQFVSSALNKDWGEYDYIVFLGQGKTSDLLTRQENRPFWQSFRTRVGNSIPVYMILPLSSDMSIGDAGPNVHLCFYSEYVGGDGEYAPTLKGFLDECGAERSFTLPGDGLGVYSLLTQEDVGEGITKWIYTPPVSDRSYICASEPMSLLSFAYQLRSVIPFKIAIKFSENLLSPPSISAEIAKSTQNKIGWHPVSDYMEYLPKFVKQNLQVNPIVQPVIQPVNPPSHEVTKSLSHEVTKSPNHEVTKSRSHESSRPIFVPIVEKKNKPRLHLKPLTAHIKVKKPKLSPRNALVVNSLLVAITVYFLTLVVSCTVTFFTMRKMVQTLPNNNFLSNRDVAIAKPPAIYMQANITAVSSLPLINKLDSVRVVNRLLSAYILALDTSRSASDLSATSKSIASYVLGEGEGNIVNDINTARLQINDIYDKLSLLDGVLPPEPPPIIPSRFKDSYISAKNRIGEARRTALTGKSLLAVAPNILGIGDRRKYAVLLQNNMELRATGGFIGSFAIISFENGKFFDEQVYDVYSADGQLKGHVEPPEEIKKYLGEANWYLRDSNWDPDFPTSARRVEWFLSKTLSQDVQGVVGINLFTLQDVMKSLGTVHLDDYSEDISADNLFERAEYHAEVNFFPGSTAKKEFLGSLADVVIGKLKTLSSDQLLSVLEAIGNSMDEKNTVMAFADGNTDRTLSTLGWNGEVRDVPCIDTGSSCTNDYAMLVDSNFGVNKANYFVKRNLSMDVMIQPDFSLSHTLKVEYTNTAKSSAWPAGPYKNYSRLYLPLGSVVSSVQIGYTIIKKDDIKISSEHNRTIAGFLVEVPLDSTVPVIVKYASPSSLSEHNSAYSLFWQKQPGTSPDPLKVHVSYPTSLEPEIVSPKASFEPGSLGFALTNVTDRRVTIKFK